MKLTALSLPENFLNKGLDAIEINRLGDVVAIAGKNGSGKTRLLDIINMGVSKFLMTSSNYSATLMGRDNIQNAIARENPSDPRFDSWKKH